MANTQLPNGSQQPRILQLMQWIANPLRYLDTCAEEYGDVFTLRLASFNPLVFLSHPQAIQEIFTVDAKHFDSGRANGIIRPLVGEHSLLLLDGASHQRQWRLLMPPFHGERMHSYSQLMPNQFKPERFIERQFSPYEYLPFGGGNRRCLGLAIAQLEMKLVLATILSNYQLALADSKPVKPQRRGLTIAPTGGIRMVLQGRHHRKEQTSQTTISSVSTTP